MSCIFMHALSLMSLSSHKNRKMGCDNDFNFDCFLMKKDYHDNFSLSCMECSQKTL